MHALLSAITVGTRLVMVGDVNQLPSVGPGCVLRESLPPDSAVWCGLPEFSARPARAILW